MDIIIHRRDILPHEPPSTWLAWFDSMVRIQGREDSLLIQGHLGLLWLYCNPESRGFAAWARDKEVLPAFNGAGLDLRGLSLQGANLYEASLRGADLRGADLRRADLRGADLRVANLEGADLGEARLYGADIYGVNLQGANLGGADIQWANLYRANLKGTRRLSEDPPIHGQNVVNSLLVKE